MTVADAASVGLLNQDEKFIVYYIAGRDIIKMF